MEYPVREIYSKDILFLSLFCKHFFNFPLISRCYYAFGRRNSRLPQIPFGFPQVVKTKEKGSTTYADFLAISTC